MERGSISLMDLAGGSLDLSASSEEVWIEVIRKMDEAYADLVHTQVELERQNEALGAANRFIESVLAAMTDVLIVCDLQGRIEQVNEALCYITGQRAADLLEQKVTDILQMDAAQQARIFWEMLQVDALGMGEMGQKPNNMQDCEVHLMGFDGQPTPLTMSLSARQDGDGRVVGLVLIGRPIGELRRAYDDLNQAHQDLQQAQQRLVHSEKMASLGRLVAGVAHELNNPISFVFGNMHALKRYGARIGGYLQATQQPVDAVQLAQLRGIYKIERTMADLDPLIEGTLEGAERVRDIIQDLRGYSGGQRESVRPYDLTEVIQTAVQWVTNAVRVKPELHLQLIPGLTLRGRRGQVHQILVNLLQNALDVMEGMAAPSLNICCERLPNKVRIDVRDAGPGIDAGDLHQLFDPFFTTKAVGKGTGLGLYISYGLAQDQGGDLTACNHAQGGACFSLTLPLEGDERHG
ncbi:PAS/PAC sensor signal transduction histidine kinase [Magnetococcus marinus MC-1]|uniref:histidine kinase n=1 Tax=Magnetococcus marinus (strain ATCC BAA-1437 / JCM 17883 / MC-1) TaxID=156889 RepID=A0LAK2_MAGMM|nr:ATP-binding protein [Magnetococcus marinus]ABK44995.1 PAS/PAC sensor signal transduction histidine kinase [Magnetococcus marinus MC-1]